MQITRNGRTVVMLMLGVLLVAGARVVADISITPAYVEVKLDQRRPSGEFLISNLGEQEERYRIQAITFSLSPTGVMLRDNAGERTMAPWIIFNPKEFTLAPKTKRSVRFVVSPRGALRPGEYWAGMELESLTQKFSKGTDAGGREMNIEVVSSILVPIFGQFGKVTYTGGLQDLRLDARDGKACIFSTIENTGTGRLLVTGQFEVRDAAGAMVKKGYIDRTYVFPGMQRHFTTTMIGELPDGKYTVRVSFASPQLAKPLEQQIDVEWKTPPPPAEPAAPAPPPVPATPPTP